ncbi:MAG: ribbon-helix-helix protein, CopG family [Patulibacter sp.]
MTNVLIRDVPDDDLERLDARASYLGLSRSELLRRCLHEEASRPAGEQLAPVDWARFARDCADLADPEIMRQAWS